MLVVASEVHRAHSSLEISKGALVPSAESPDRADMITDALRLSGHSFALPVPVERGLLERVHSADYLDFLEGAWGRWIEDHDPDVPAM